jgi:hypothetical protein
MKLPVLTMAAAALPMVPPAYRPLAAAVLDEFKAHAQKAADQAAHIERLTLALKELQAHAVKLTDALNTNIGKTCRLVEVTETHTERLNALSN